MYVFICTTAYGPLGPKFGATLLARVQEKIGVFGIFVNPDYVIYISFQKNYPQVLGCRNHKWPTGPWATGPVVGFGAHVQEKVYVIGVFVNPDVHVDPNV